MKKLLSLLGAIIIGASASQSVVSFSYGPNMKKFIDKEVKFYSEVSAEALKSGILADQNLNIQGKTGVGLDLDFASNYFASQHILSRFPDLVDPKQGAKPGSTAEVASLYQTVFGTTQGGFKYTIKNSFGSLKDANGVKADSTLGKLVNGKTEDDLQNAKEKFFKQPDSSTASTLSMISGIANIVFKNDFSPSMASTVIGLLASNTIRSLFTGDSADMITGIFKKVDTVVSNNSVQIEHLLSSLTQSDTAQDDIEASTTYREQLSKSTQNLFKGLIYFLSPDDKKVKYNEAGHKDDAATAFWNMIIKSEVSDDYVEATPFMKAKAGTDDAGKSTKEFDIDNLNDFIDSIANCMDFAISVLHYFRAFDEYYSKVKQPLSGNLIFDGKVNNQDVIEDILNKNYVDGSTKNNQKDVFVQDDFWYREKKDASSDKVTYTTKFNLQNLISDLEYCLKPDDDNDPNGYSLLRPITILLGGTAHSFNPILETALNPLLSTNSDGILLKLISTWVDNTIPDVPFILDGDQKRVIESTLLGIVKTLLNSNVMNWFTSDGCDQDSTFVSGLIEQLADLANAIPLNSILSAANASEKSKEIVALVEAGLRYLTSSNGKALLDHPWSHIYSGGFLYGISGTLREIGNSSLVNMPKQFNAIAKALASLKDVRNILTMKVNTLLKNVNTVLGAFGVDAIALPDWLYNARDKSISDLVQYLAETWLDKTDISNPDNNWKTTALNTLSENNRYAFNSGALSELISGLIPNKTGDKKVDDPERLVIYQTDTNATESDYMNGTIVSPMWPLFYAIKYFSANTAVESDESFKYAYWVVSPSINDGKPKQIINPKLLNDGTADEPSMLVVSNNALEDLLGVETVDNKPSFIKYSILGSLSRIYGHDYFDYKGNSKDYPEMFNGAASIFALFTNFAQFAVDSVAKLTEDDYAKYFDPKQWSIRNTRQTNLDNDNPTSDTIQYLDYDLVFNNPDDGVSYTYHISMHRQAVDLSDSAGNASTGWIVDKLMRQN